MALITCPDCNTKFSDSATSCPKCGAVLSDETKAGILQAEKKAAKKSQTVGLILVGAVLLVFAMCTIGGNSSRSSAPEPKSISAQVKWNASQFQITNADSFDWTNIRMTVNGKYRLTAKGMTAGEVYTVGMAQFTDDNGTRFNPFQTKVMNIFIGSDEGTYYGEAGK